MWDCCVGVKSLQPADGCLLERMVNMYHNNARGCGGSCVNLTKRCESPAFGASPHSTAKVFHKQPDIGGSVSRTSAGVSDGDDGGMVIGKCHMEYFDRRTSFLPFNDDTTSNPIKKNTSWMHASHLRLQYSINVQIVSAYTALQSLNPATTCGQHRAREATCFTTAEGLNL